MHILHVVRPAAGGIRRHVSLLAEGLAERGHAVAVAAPAGFVLDQTSAAPRTPIPVHPVPLTARPHPLKDLQAARLIARHAREADLLHGHGLRGAWVGALAAQRAGRPFLFTAHNLAPPDPGLLTRFLFGFAARGAGAVIAVSNAVAESLRPYGVAPGKTVRVPNGVDLAPFDRPADRAALLTSLGLGADAGPLIAAVGRLSPEKGFDVLIWAAKGVLSRRPDARFVLAGDGPERERLAALVRELGLGERFLLAGYLADAAGLILAADLVAVPSRQEGQGITALEAMAAGKPVAASDVGGLAETVEDGTTGLLVPPEDPAALADAILRLAGDPEAARRLGEAGRRRVEEAYTLDRMIDRTLEVYRYPALTGFSSGTV